MILAPRFRKGRGNESTLEDFYSAVCFNFIVYLIIVDVLNEASYSRSGAGSSRIQHKALSKRFVNHSMICSCVYQRQSLRRGQSIRRYVIQFDFDYRFKIQFLGELGKRAIIIQKLDLHDVIVYYSSRAHASSISMI